MPPEASPDSDSRDDEDSFERHKPAKQTEHKIKFRHVSKLLSLAAEGKHRKIVKLLRKHPGLDINSYTSEGFTALHQASRFGHPKAARVLLQLGADSKAEDFHGNTAAHLAAARKEIGVLAVLLQDKSQLDVLDSEGMAALKDHLRFVVEEKHSPSSAPGSKTSHPTESPAAFVLPDSGGEWDEKLRMNASYDDPFQDEFLGSTSSTWESWEYDSFVDPGFEPEDEEAYARKMWEDMQRKNRSQQQAGPATAESWAKADSAQKRREKAAADAAEHSRRILDEEQEKDRAWRQAVLQGDQSAKRAAYEAKWQTLATTAGPIVFGDIPWLAADETTARALILCGVQGSAERKKRLRLELMRWHPDKFVAKFGRSVVPADQHRVAEGVKHVSQMLNSLGNG